MPVNISSPPSAPPERTLISDETIAGAAAANFTAVSIGAGYRSIEVELCYQCTSNANGAGITFNGDAGNNYNFETVNGTGAVAGAGAVANTSLISLGYQTAAVPTIGVARINQDAVMKKCVVWSGGNGSRLDFTAGYWNNTALITSVLVSTTNTFIIGSRLRIWGIK